MIFPSARSEGGSDTGFWGDLVSSGPIFKQFHEQSDVGGSIWISGASVNFLVIMWFC